jgi:Ca-activated chloride channel homolog
MSFPGKSTLGLGILTLPIVFVVLTLVSAARGQGMILPPIASVNGFDPQRLDMVMEVSQDRWQHHLESLSSASKLDLNVPVAAYRQYEKGAHLLIDKKFDQAVEPLTKAISIYPKYVGAHNALGLAYLRVGRNQEAEVAFSQSVALDDHLPYSFLNLSWAQIAVKDFRQAEATLQKASDLAPLDLHLLTALAYAQLLNQDYSGVIATTEKVHNRKHEAAAVVHYFAAAAWQAQGRLDQTQTELQTYLQEDPQSPFADAAKHLIVQIQDQQKNSPAAPVQIAFNASPLDPDVTTSGIPAQARSVMNEAKQRQELAEVEAEPESICESCPEASTARSATSHMAESKPNGLNAAYTLRSTVNEVALFFAATDHEKAVTDLQLGELTIRDAGRAPASVLSFHNESELPLRLGLVIDTSNSIIHQFAFEQKAANTFLKKSLTGKSDLAFIVGFSNSVLLVRDFTADSAKIEEGIDVLAPAGGTALWDAVKFASDKLGALAEEKPVAKMLVVISDGEDNSSSATLKEAIESAERHEIAIYTVSTRELAGGNDAKALTADGAMKALAARTGGAAFFPNSLGNLEHRLADLQQVIRSRYLVSYKPSHFAADGSYRTIAVSANRMGRKLRVYVRRGYYAPSAGAKAQ